MHDCFTRELKDGARPIDADPAVLVSPCDAIVGACGRIDGTELLQIKGFPYSLPDLLGAPQLVERYTDGTYVTLRLTSSMYHRFHAPHDCRVERVTYISGDTWNVNPIALRRIEKLFCKNERAVIQTRLAVSGDVVTLVPVAAILVASIRLNFLRGTLDLRYRGPNVYPVRGELQEGPGDGLVRARLDHHRAGAGAPVTSGYGAAGQAHTHGRGAGAAGVNRRYGRASDFNQGPARKRGR